MTDNETALITYFICQNFTPEAVREAFTGADKNLNVLLEAEPKDFGAIADAAQTCHALAEAWADLMGDVPLTSLDDDAQQTG